MEDYKRAWAEVDLSAMKKNFQAVRREVGERVKVMAVVKANAYGHGVAQVAPFLDRLGADYFGVSCLQEAMELREIGLCKPVLILGYTNPSYYKCLLEHAISQTIYTPEDAKAFSAAAQACGKEGRVHLALDTGMGRIGLDAFDASRASAEAVAIASLPGLRLEGLFTHFSVADTDGEEPYTAKQFERFMAVRAALLENGFSPLCHVANSAGIFLDPAYHLDMVRAGIVLYGLEPGGRENPFYPVMTVKTTVTHIKEVPAGRSISYGRHYTTPVPRTIATLGVGYADGYPRPLSGRASVFLHGRPAPVTGNVCMDQMMADVTGIPCKVGDEVTLMGGAMPLAELAHVLGTIHYELVCGISARVRRVYLLNGEIIG